MDGKNSRKLEEEPRRGGGRDLSLEIPMRVEPSVPESPSLQMERMLLETPEATVPSTSELPAVTAPSVIRPKKIDLKKMHPAFRVLTPFVEDWARRIPEMPDVLGLMDNILRPTTVNGEPEVVTIPEFDDREIPHPKKRKRKKNIGKGDFELVSPSGGNQPGPSGIRTTSTSVQKNSHTPTHTVTSDTQRRSHTFIPHTQAHRNIHARRLPRIPSFIPPYLGSHNIHTVIRETPQHTQRIITHTHTIPTDQLAAAGIRFTPYSGGTPLVAAVVSRRRCRHCRATGHATEECPREYGPPLSRGYLLYRGPPNPGQW